MAIRYFFRDSPLLLMQPAVFPAVPLPLALALALALVLALVQLGTGGIVIRLR